MKAEFGAGIACQQALLDNVTNNWSFIGCLERLGVLRTPCTLPGFALAVRLDLEAPAPADTEFEVQFFREDADGESLIGQPGFTFPAGAHSRWTWMHFRFLRIKAEGPITFRAKWRKEGAKAWRSGRIATISVVGVNLNAHERDDLLAQLDGLAPLG